MSAFPSLQALTARVDRPAVPCRNPLCGRPLTDPVSQALGYGPDCAAALGLIPPRGRNAGHTGPTLLDLIPRRKAPMTAPGVEQQACRSRTPDEDAAVRRALLHRQQPPAVPVAGSYDANPTVASRDPNAYADYAQRLDTYWPGWWQDDLDGMAGELAAEALKRRDSQRAS